MLFNKIIFSFCFIYLFYLDSTCGQRIASRIVRPTGPVNQTCLGYLKNSNKELSDSEKCNFMKCFENRFPCGPNYWIINWGYKYCVKYTNIEQRPDITSKSIEMFNAMSLCMAKQLESLYVSNKAIDCKILYTNAFKFQAKCYMKMGEKFCNIVRENGSEMRKLIDKSDLTNNYAMKMFKKATSICKPEIDLTEF